MSNSASHTKGALNTGFPGHLPKARGNSTPTFDTSGPEVTAVFDILTRSFNFGRVTAGQGILAKKYKARGVSKGKFQRFYDLVVMVAAVVAAVVVVVVVAVAVAVAVAVVVVVVVVAAVVVVVVVGVGVGVGVGVVAAALTSRRAAAAGGGVAAAAAAATAVVVVVAATELATDHSRLLSCANRARGTNARGSQRLPFCEA